MVTSMRESGWMIRDMATELISGMMETGTLESGNLIKDIFAKNWNLADLRQNCGKTRTESDEN